MIAFRFRLQKVMQLRESQLEVEEARFKQQVAALAELDRARAELEAAGIRTELQVRQWNRLDGADLSALNGFRRGLKKQEQEIASRREQHLKALRQQQTALLEARRRCRLLERLRERRHAEWQAAFDQELEEMAAESFLAGWSRRQREADAP